MKLSIELTKAEVAGIKAYFREVDGNNKVTTAQIKQYIQGIVSGTIHAPQEAVSSYIDHAEFSEAKANSHFQS